MDLVNDHEDYSVWFTGHSAGATKAAMQAVKFNLKNGLMRGHLITFGSPRVGDHLFARTVETRTEFSVRVVNGRDEGAKLPNCAWDEVTKQCKQDIGQPYHYGDVVWYSAMPGNNGGDSSNFVSCKAGEDQNCGDANPDRTSKNWELHWQYFGLDAR